MKTRSKKASEDQCASTNPTLNHIERCRDVHAGRRQRLFARFRNVIGHPPSRAILAP
jgi:hypothetical protein